MRKVFTVTVVVDHGHATVAVGGLERIGGVAVPLQGLPELDLIMDENEPTSQLLKDTLVHVIEHL